MTRAKFMLNITDTKSTNKSVTTKEEHKMGILSKNVIKETYLGLAEFGCIQMRSHNWLTGLPDKF